MSGERRRWTLVGRHDGQGAIVIGGPSLPPGTGGEIVVPEQAVADAVRAERERCIAELERFGTQAALGAAGLLRNALPPADGNTEEEG